MREHLLTIFRRLSSAFGPMRWWPAQTPFEVMVGAILTQNTAWTNVERAIANLRAEGLLSPQALYEVREDRLCDLIRPAGYFNVKARRLRHFLEYFLSCYGGDVERMRQRETAALRRELLSVNGIGPETADSILLYALHKPVFVVDAYTHRLFSRLGLIEGGATYDEVQCLFASALPEDVALFNEYHALIVAEGKCYCRKRPLCPECPLMDMCPFPERRTTETRRHGEKKL